LGRRSAPYSKGEVNKIIDSLLHPLMKGHPWLVMVDGLLHAINEGGQKSLEKFIRYNIKPLVEAIEKELRRQVEQRR